ncbi:MAG: iron ABC transporter substrate-binding protein [Dehalococcoidia bacterium]
MRHGAGGRGRRLAGAVAAVLLLTAGLVLSGCGGDDDEVLTIYAGRSQNLVQPLLEQFSEDTGVRIRVKYGDGTDLALGILEEGEHSPADVYYTQDIGALGALKAAGRLQELPSATLNQVSPAFRSPDALWVGISGRARVVVYNTDDLDPATLPSSILDYTDSEWRGQVGIVPRSDGFPEFVTALRLTRGEEFARTWLRALKVNEPKTYPNNLAAIQAVANGEVQVAFLNHYYLYRFLEEQGDGFKARNYYFSGGDLGGLFVVSGAAVLDTAQNRTAAERFIDYLLTPSAQEYFAEQTFEYPLVTGVSTDTGLPPISEMEPPELDLSDLNDLQGSLDLMRETGILP